MILDGYIHDCHRGLSIIHGFGGELVRKNEIILRVATLDDVKGLAKVHVDSWRSTYRGIVNDAYLESLSYEKREQLWHQVIGDDTCIWVAESMKDGIVGFVSGGIERGQNYSENGEIYAIYLLKAYQRHGIGEELLSQMLHHLRMKKMKKIKVWVLLDNPSRDFYRKMGAKEIGRATFELGGQELIEVAYGWGHTDEGDKKQEEE